MKLLFIQKNVDWKTVKKYPVIASDGFELLKEISG